MDVISLSVTEASADESREDGCNGAIRLLLIRDFDELLLANGVEACRTAGRVTTNGISTSRLGKAVGRATGRVSQSGDSGDEEMRLTLPREAVSRYCQPRRRNYRRSR